MTQAEPLERRPRGQSAKGDFEQAKSTATRSEEARIAADRRKTEALREVRFRQSENQKAAK